jgi:hypothetical protein
MPEIAGKVKQKMQDAEAGQITDYSPSHKAS